MTKSINKDSLKIILKLFLFMMMVQALRFGIKEVAFVFTGKTQALDTYISAIFMIVFTAIFILVINAKKISLSFLPTKRKVLYTIGTIVFTVLVAVNIKIADKTVFAITTILYSVIITPVFEELIFRGYMWNRLKEKYDNEFVVFVITTLLFAVWHLGYTDSVALRTGTSHLPFVMLMKVVTGLIFGVILGAVRYKTKNTYSTILLHGLMNMFGR